LYVQEYDHKLLEMQEQYEREKVSNAKLEQDMNKLKAFYDNKLVNLNVQIEKLPTTAESEYQCPTSIHWAQFENGKLKISILILLHKQNLYFVLKIRS